MKEMEAELDRDEEEIRGYLRRIYTEKEIDELLKSDEEETDKASSRIVESVEKTDKK